jgi:hypothetical protein
MSTNFWISLGAVFLFIIYPFLEVNCNWNLLFKWQYGNKKEIALCVLLEFLMALGSPFMMFMFFDCFAMFFVKNWDQAMGEEKILKEFLINSYTTGNIFYFITFAVLMSILLWQFYVRKHQKNKWDL